MEQLSFSDLETSLRRKTRKTRTERLTETLKLSRSVPDVLFLQIALDDGTINPVSSKIRRMFC